LEELHFQNATLTESESESEAPTSANSIKLRMKEDKAKLKKNKEKINSQAQMENKQHEKKEVKIINTNKKNYFKNLKIKRIIHKKSTIKGDNDKPSSGKTAAPNVGEKHKESNCKYNLRSKKKEPDKIKKK
jgi:hypothetical protein